MFHNTRSINHIKLSIAVIFSVTNAVPTKIAELHKKVVNMVKIH